MSKFKYFINYMFTNKYIIYSYKIIKKVKCICYT